MPDLDYTDLTTEDDTVLDAALATLFRDHRTTTGTERDIQHACIDAILDEQSRRLGHWLEERDVSATTTGAQAAR